MTNCDFGETEPWRSCTNNKIKLNEMKIVLVLIRDFSSTFSIVEMVSYQERPEALLVVLELLVEDPWSKPFTFIANIFTNNIIMAYKICNW